MNPTYIINYHDLSVDELCQYLEERCYSKILLDMESIQECLLQMIDTEDSELLNILHVVFFQLQTEVKQLFTKDRIILFRHIKSRTETPINLIPISQIHQKINTIMMQLRKLLNNYVQQPDWSNAFKICFNELYLLEQSLQHVLYLKENFLWTQVNKSMV